MSSFCVRLLSGFSDPACPPDRWEQLVNRGPTRTVFLTRQFLQAWWVAYARDELLLVAAERDGEIFSIAPLYSVDGTVCLLGSHESDYCDFIGDPGGRVADGPEVVAAMLEAAAGRTTDFDCHLFPLVPECSPTRHYLKAAADRLGMGIWLRKEVPVVEIDLAARVAEVESAVGRSMAKRERAYQRRGDFVVRQLTRYEDIRPHLPTFFDQHIARWEQKGEPSQYLRPQPRAFLERFVKDAADAGWARFLVLLLDGRLIAGEFGWHYRGTHFSGPWCFDAAESDHSPGQVLLRQSVTAAMTAGLHTYDLGLGDQPYKFRLPVRTQNCQSWQMYRR